MKIIKRRSKPKAYLLGYADKDIRLYKTNLKPLGKVVAGLGFVCLGVAVFPNCLGVVFYPLGFGLLGVVGIDPFKYKKVMANKIRFIKWRHL